MQVSKPPYKPTGKVPCLGCSKQINPKHTICAACNEDMGGPRRAQ